MQRPSAAAPIRAHFTVLLAIVVSILWLRPLPALAQTTYFPAKGVYNGFLNQTNIVECDNNNSQAVSVNLVMTRSDGTVVANYGYAINGFGSQHVILNGLTNITDTYGVYTLSLGEGQQFLGDRVSCRTAFYRNAAANAGKQFEYAYALPVQNPQLGKLAGVYNSYDPAGTGALTNNWLSVVNFDSAPMNGTVTVYRGDGTILETDGIGGLAPGARLDIPLGHPQGQTTGLYVITPENPSQLYDAFLVRYNTAAGGNFNFAFPLRAVTGACAGEPLLASTMGNGLTHNWLEIANANSIEIGVTIEVRDRAGNLLFSERRAIPSFGQSNLYLSSIIDPTHVGNVGSARVLCDDASDKLIIQSSFYGRIPNKVSTEWAYATQARGTSLVTKDALLSVPINTYVGMANWLKLADSSLSPTLATYSLFDQAGTTVSQGQQDIAAGGTADIDTHTQMGADKIGSFLLGSSTATASFSGEMLRVLSRTNGQIGNIISIPGAVLQKGVDGATMLPGGATGGLVGFRGDPQSLMSYRDQLTHEESEHLLSRVSFGGSPADVAFAEHNGLTAAVNKLMTLSDDSAVEAAAAAWLDGDTGTPGIQYSQGGVRRYWLHHMVNSPNTLKERMALFFHDMFAASCRVIDTGNDGCYNYIQLMRSQSLGNFKTFVNALDFNYLMVIWLNGNLNVKRTPDENYAREHWELFTMGEKTKFSGRYPLYTEDDVAEAARAFTGIEAIVDGSNHTSTYYDSTTTRTRNRHDGLIKTIWRGTPYEVSGNFHPADMTNLTLDTRPEAAKQLARRLFTYFVHDHPSAQTINQLADMIRSYNWELKPVIEVLISSEAFFSPQARRNKVKDPVSYMVGFLRTTGIKYRIDSLENYLNSSGLILTDPPDVSGWPLSKPNQDPKTDYYMGWQANYANFIRNVMTGLQTGQTAVANLRALMPSNSATGEEVVDYMAAVLDVQLTADQRTALITYMNSQLNANGTTTARTFNPAAAGASGDNYVRTKVAGLLWILTQHEDFMTY